MAAHTSPTTAKVPPTAPELLKKPDEPLLLLLLPLNWPLAVVMAKAVEVDVWPLGKVIVVSDV